eukprot:TRINITY_DN2969_c0_g2_i1.p1 TRINITY_DN2969_c0_g2~~TRINITY_DN2969_c0_g2_i1.p1  ORF type:complete len:199 (-),score=39.40 TRINITY_DN2969_c0_g2_i1:164-760(-)
MAEGRVAHSLVLAEIPPLLLSPRTEHDMENLMLDSVQSFVTPARSCVRFDSAGPARSKHVSKPPLLQALISRSTDQVRLALELDPEAAQFPFWDHGLETALCCAVRNKCGSGIFELLLNSGADASVADPNGNLPLTLLNAKLAQLEDFPVVQSEDFPVWTGDLADFDLPGLSSPPSHAAELEDMLRIRNLLEAASNPV